MSDERWIEIVDWDRYQHYKGRSAPWIKTYVALLHDPNYLSLPPATRALLHELWLLYASSHRQIRHSTLTLSRLFGHRVFTKQLEALNHAGFIRFSASNPLALARSREGEREKNVVKGSKRTLSRALETHDDEELFDYEESPWSSKTSG